MNRAEGESIGPVVGIVVSVDDDHLDDIDEVVADLRDAGMRVDDVLGTVGMVTGAADPGSLDTLGSVPGVAGVEPAHGYLLPPPDSEVQ